MKIVYLEEISLTKSDLKEIGLPTLSVISTLSYAYNELSVFMGLFISSKGYSGVDLIVEKKLAIQKQAIMRAMNAKIFETLKAVGESKKLLAKEKDLHGVGIILQAEGKLDDLMNARGFKISQYLRSKVTAHYLPNRVQENINNIEELSPSTIYAHGSVGDTFYPFAEDYVFGSALKRVAADHGISVDEAGSEWMEWSMKAVRFVLDVVSNIMTHLLLEKLPQKSSSSRMPYVKPEYVNVGGERPLPLFHALPSQGWRSGA